MSMLYDIDSEFGHVIKKVGDGVVYADDGSPVDFANPRPCVGCNVKCAPGQHDPCIANLPNTRNACCGHGLANSPRTGLPNGYVAFEDGRTFRFLGTVGGAAIRAAVQAALAGEPLPEGFTYDEDKPWWHGLTDAQKGYVQANMVRGLHGLVIASGAAPSEAFLAGKAMWFDGVSEEHRTFVIQNTPSMLTVLVQEALLAHPSGQ